MASERDRVWSARLIQFFIITAIGFGFFFVVIHFYTKQNKARLDKPAAELQDARAVIQASNRILPMDPVLKIAQDALSNMQKTVFDYTATLEKQERISEKLGEPQFIKLKVMSRSPRPGSDQPHPLHAYFRFVEPSSAAGREVIWVEGQNKDLLVAHEAGFMNVMRVNLEPTSMLAMRGNKYPANQVGFENLLRKLIEKGLSDRDEVDCIVEIETDHRWEERPAQRIVVTHPQKKPSVDFHQAEIIIDQEWQLPVSYTAYLWPDDGSHGDPPVEERYVYRNLKINVGLTAEDFNPDNPNYDFP